MPTRATLNKLKRSKLYLRIGVVLLSIYIVVVTTLVWFQILYLRSDLVMEQEQAREDFEYRIDKSLDHIKSEHERTHNYIYCVAQALTTENGKKAIAGLESCGISIEVDKDSVSYAVPALIDPIRSLLNNITEAL